MRYIRHGKFFVLIGTKGRHEFFEKEQCILDVRRFPIRYAGYSISYRRGVDRKWHVSVRIAPDEYLRLKNYFLGLAVHRSVENLSAEFQRIPFEPYAAIRRQLLNILRSVNRARYEAGFELVSVSVLRLRRKIVKPFGDDARRAFDGQRLGRWEPSAARYVPSSHFSDYCLPRPGPAQDANSIRLRNGSTAYETP